MVLGEALVDLFEGECDGEPVYRPMVGGGPLNVAVGLARLGLPVALLGSVSTDAFGHRIRTFLDSSGVDHGACVPVGVPTTLAVTSLRAGEPEFHFYGVPPCWDGRALSTCPPRWSTRRPPSTVARSPYCTSRRGPRPGLPCYGPGLGAPSTRTCDPPR